MREIKFRGKRIDNGEWVYGYYSAYVEQGDNGGVEHLYRETATVLHYISDIEGNLYIVYPETVGQYTGLKDKNGKEIYEGDILQVKAGWYKSNKESESDKFDNSVKGTTYWTVEHKVYNASMGYFTFGIDRRWKRPLTQSRLYNASAEIIGNIHDNSDLLQK